MPPARSWMWFIAILVLNYLFVRTFMPGPEEPLTVPYTFFKEQVAKGNVKAIYSQGAAITGRFVEAITYPPVEEQKPVPPDAASKDRIEGLPTTPTKPSRDFATTLPSFVDPALEALLIGNKVEISA